MRGAHFSRSLSDLVENSGLTKSQLAERAGISRTSLYNLLNGDVAESKLSTLMRLSSALGVNPLVILQPYLTYRSRNEYASAQEQVTTLDDNRHPEFKSVISDKKFIKSWSITNVGNIRWDALKLTCQNIQGTDSNIATGLNPAHFSIPVPYIAPGDKLLVSIELAAKNMKNVLEHEMISHSDAVDVSHLSLADKEPLCCIVKVLPCKRS